MSLQTPEQTRTPLPTIPGPASGKADIDYELFLDCVHCGLCTSACPTYVENGDENDSPRGRIYLMRAVTDGRLELSSQVKGHLDLCLDCRACETACPSGVQYGKLIEPFRIHLHKTGASKENLSWLKRLLLYGITPYARRMRWALAPARFMQWTGLDGLMLKSGLLRLLPKTLRDIHGMLPPLRPHYGRLPELLPAEGPRRARVALFTGCAADAMYPETTQHTAWVLQKNGCDVWIPRNQVCCGALHYHAAREGPAQAFGQENCRAFFPRTPVAQAPGSPSLQEVDAIISNAAGCGAMLKDYGHLLQHTPMAREGGQFAHKVKDISEFLYDLGPVKPTHPLPIKAVYHDACHLCHAQQIRKQPRHLLEMIPGLKLVPLIESELCCGAAGSYNLTQPDMAERLGLRKADNLLAALGHAEGAEAIFAANVGCLLQIGRYLRQQRPGLWIAHPIDALWASYSGCTQYQ